MDEHAVEELFPHPLGLGVLRAVADAVDAIGDHEVRVSRSQVAFRRREAFEAAA